MANRTTCAPGSTATSSTPATSPASGARGSWSRSPRSRWWRRSSPAGSPAPWRCSPTAGTWARTWPRSPSRRWPTCSRAAGPSDARFAFGTWKIEVLGAFSSALRAGRGGARDGVESLVRLARPAPIDFGPALVVAVIGLVVNLASAWILGGGQHGHDHGTTATTMTTTTTTTTTTITTTRHDHARTTTSTCARPTRTCSPTRSPRSSPSSALAGRPLRSAGPGSIRRWASSARAVIAWWSKGLLRGIVARAARPRDGLAAGGPGARAPSRATATRRSPTCTCGASGASATPASCAWSPTRRWPPTPIARGCLGPASVAHATIEVNRCPGPERLRRNKGVRLVHSRIDE